MAAAACGESYVQYLLRRVSSLIGVDLLPCLSADGASSVAPAFSTAQQLLQFGCNLVAIWLQFGCNLSSIAVAGSEVHCYSLAVVVKNRLPMAHETPLELGARQEVRINWGPSVQL